MIFGIGAGWFQHDYDEYGYEFGTAPDRLRALARNLPLIKSRLAKLNPAPLGALPILIGGRGEQVTLRLVAEHAQTWHTFVDSVEEYRGLTAVLAQHRVRAGRDPNRIDHVLGSLSDTLRLADDLADAGVAEFTIRVSGPDYDLGELREAIQWRDRHNATTAA